MLVLQGFLDVSLHLHLTNFNKLSGAAAKSVIIGANIDPLSFQPHCLGSKLLLYFLRCFDSFQQAGFPMPECC